MKWVGKILVPAAFVLLVGCGETNGEDGEPSSDGGTPCTDIDQCEGWCEPPFGSELGDTVTGTCSDVLNAPCREVVENGVYTARVCD